MRAALGEPVHRVGLPRETATGGNADRLRRRKDTFRPHGQQINVEVGNHQAKRRKPEESKLTVGNPNRRFAGVEMGDLILCEDGRFLVSIFDPMIQPNLGEASIPDLVARFWEGKIRRGALGRMPVAIKEVFRGGQLGLGGFSIEIAKAGRAHGTRKDRAPLENGHHTVMDRGPAVGERREPDEAGSLADMAAPEGIAEVKVGKVFLRKPWVLVLHWTFNSRVLSDWINRSLEKAHGVALRVDVVIYKRKQTLANYRELFYSARLWQEGWGR